MEESSFSHLKKKETQRGREKDEEAGIEMTEEPQQNEMPTLQMTQMPTSLLLRETLQYPKVYSATSMVDKKDSSITGSQIAYSWHPRYEKVVYTLDKGTLDEVSLKEMNRDMSLANLTRPKAARLRRTTNWQEFALCYFCLY